MPSRRPFLFFNGNTFAEVARRTIDLLLADFPIGRRREAASLIPNCWPCRTACCSTRSAGYERFPDPGDRTAADHSNGSFDPFRNSDVIGNTRFWRYRPVA